MSQLLKSKFSHEEARALTDELRSDYGALQAKIGAAWRGRIWLAMGYESWQGYLDGEFSGVSLRPPKELEEQVLSELREAGMSTRGIAAATDLSQKTVSRRLKERESNDSAEAVVGLDGKTYPATAPRSEPEVVDAEVVDVLPASPVVGERLAEDMGIEPIPVRIDDSQGLIGRDRVNRLISDLHSGGGAPLPMVKKKAEALELAFTSGHVDATGLEEERIKTLGQQVADAIGVLTDLLVEMADGRGTDGVTVTALGNRDTLGSIGKAQRNLAAVVRQLEMKGVAA